MAVDMFLKNAVRIYGESKDPGGDTFDFQPQLTSEPTGDEASASVWMHDNTVKKFLDTASPPLLGSNSDDGGIIIDDGDSSFVGGVYVAVGNVDGNAATDGARVPPYNPEWTDFNSSDPGLPQVALFDDWLI